MDMPELMKTNSANEFSTRIDQMLNIRFLHLTLLSVLLMFIWPTMLHADSLEDMPQEQDSKAILLVASKKMADPRFRKTVLLVTKHGKSGPIGVILNRPESVTLDKLFPEYPAAKELSLFEGGPVYPGQVSYLVRGGDAAERTLEISSNIYLAYDLPYLEELLSGKRHYKDLRVLHGMASWAPGQLEYEVQLGDWDILPVDEAAIFEQSPSEMWKELNTRVSSSHEI